MSQYNCLDRQQVAQRPESQQAQKGFSSKIQDRMLQTNMLKGR